MNGPLAVLKWILYGAIGIAASVITVVIGLTLSLILTAAYSIAVALGISALTGLVIQDLLETPDKEKKEKPP